MVIKNKTIYRTRPEENEKRVKIEKYCDWGTIEKTDKDGFVLELYLVLNKDLKGDHFFFPKLENLTIYGEGFKLQSANFLNLHKNLKKLWINNCQLELIPKLDNLRKLQDLSLARNKIQSLDEFKNLSNSKSLQKIFLNFNRIDNLEGIGALLELPNLKTLIICHSSINSLDGIEQLTNHESLEELILENNEITDLNITAKIPNLKKIDLEHNRISKITALRNLPSLEQINLSYNEIKTIKNLDNLPSLKKITVGCNPLKEFRKLERLPSLETIEYLTVTEWEREEFDKLKSYLDTIGFYSREPEKEIFLDADTDFDYEHFLNIYKRECVTQFKVNKYLSLKLMLDSRIRSETMIYVDGIPFKQCSFLLFTVPTSDFDKTDVINSIDEAASFLNPIMENGLPDYLKHELRPEEIFWGHCSNLQAWAEHDYDTRLIYRNLAFPLLKKLTEAGDPVALKVFKEEIAKRYSSGISSVRTFLREEGYLKLLSSEELNSASEELNSAK